MCCSRPTCRAVHGRGARRDPSLLYFVSHGDAELRPGGAPGPAREFQAFSWTGDIPDPQAEETFLRSRLDSTARARFAPSRDATPLSRSAARARNDPCCGPPRAGGPRNHRARRLDGSSGWIASKYSRPSSAERSRFHLASCSNEVTLPGTGSVAAEDSTRNRHTAAPVRTAALVRRPLLTRTRRPSTSVRFSGAASTTRCGIRLDSRTVESSRLAVASLLSLGAPLLGCCCSATPDVLSTDTDRRGSGAALTIDVVSSAESAQPTAAAFASARRASSAAATRAPARSRRPKARPTSSTACAFAGAEGRSSPAGAEQRTSQARRRPRSRRRRPPADHPTAPGRTADPGSAADDDLPYVGRFAPTPLGTTAAFSRPDLRCHTVARDHFYGRIHLFREVSTGRDYSPASLFGYSFQERLGEVATRASRPDG